MKIVVWHLNRDLAIAHGLGSDEQHMEPLVGAHAFGKLQSVQQLWAAHCYEPVAILNVPNVHTKDRALELAFSLTQHIDEAWNKKGRLTTLTPLHHEGNRSTSVGDVLQVVGDASQPLHIVAAIGFTQFHG